MSRFVASASTPTGHQGVTELQSGYVSHCITNKICHSESQTGFTTINQNINKATDRRDTCLIHSKAWKVIQLGNEQRSC